MLFIREIPGFNILYERLDPFYEITVHISVFLHEFRFEVGHIAHQIFCHQELAIAILSGPNPASANSKRIRNQLSKWCRYAFKYYAERTGLFKGSTVIKYLLRF